MDLNDILDFIKKNKDLLQDLKQSSDDVISDAKALLVKNSFLRVNEFVKSVQNGESMKADNGDDRYRALNAAILELQREQLETDDTAAEMEINQQLGDLLAKRAAVLSAKGFNEVLKFSQDEVTEMTTVLLKVEHDIEARKDVRAALRITTGVLSVAAKIAAKAASFAV